MFKFTFGKNAAEMFIDRWDRDLKQFCDLPLRQPHRLAFQPHLDPRLRILAAIQDQFRGGGVLVVVTHASS
ncbi:hypothetical protein [Xanthomonas sacchari]|uniref:hypothetical protein n=1 Tax=Xanthomonas sacchari TaxID=56458 RepID=UPI0022516EEE|nr:hypothetical protein [Xanthomonas sacchari]